MSGACRNFSTCTLVSYVYLFAFGPRSVLVVSRLRCYSLQRSIWATIDCCLHNSSLGPQVYIMEIDAATLYSAVY